MSVASEIAGLKSCDSSASRSASRARCLASFARSAFSSRANTVSPSARASPASRSDSAFTAGRNVHTSASARRRSSSRSARRRSFSSASAARRSAAPPPPADDAVSEPPAAARRSASACDAGLMCGANVAAPSASTRILSAWTFCSRRRVTSSIRSWSGRSAPPPPWLSAASCADVGLICGANGWIATSHASDCIRARSRCSARASASWWRRSGAEPSPRASNPDAAAAADLGLIDGAKVHSAIRTFSASSRSRSRRSIPF